MHDRRAVCVARRVLSGRRPSSPRDPPSTGLHALQVVREAVREAVNEERAVRGQQPSSNVKVGLLASALWPFVGMGS